MQYKDNEMVMDVSCQRRRLKDGRAGRWILTADHHNRRNYAFEPWWAEGEGITMEDLKQAVLGYLSCDLYRSETDRMGRTLNKAKVKRIHDGKEGLSMALSNAERESLNCCGSPHPQAP